MKKFLSLVVCILFAGSILAQEKFAIPERTAEQKHERTLFQLWIAGFGGGINFAKAHGVTPYDYGKYLGELFAPGWGGENNFEALVNGSIMNFEDCRLASDPALVVKENPDGSVSITQDVNIYQRYFPDGNQVVSFDEFVDCLKGVMGSIASYLGATSNLEIKDNLMIHTFKKI
jgi:hypothetical protein